MSELESLGANRLHDEIKAGRSVLPLLRDFMRDYGSANVGMLSGALSGSLALIRSAEAAGVTFEIEGRSIGPASGLAVQLTRAFAERDLMGICELTKIVAGSIDGLRSSGAINFDPPKEPEAGPLRVEVVSLPARETSTAVERDEKGNIASSTQIERDRPFM